MEVDSFAFNTVKRMFGVFGFFFPIKSYSMFGLGFLKPCIMATCITDAHFEYCIENSA